MIKQLALKLPAFGNEVVTVPQPQGVVYQGSTPNLLTTVLSDGVRIAFIIAGFLMLIWLVWGAFQYIFAGGDKAALAKARSRLTYAIFGFIFIIFSFLLSEFAKGIIPTQSVNIPTLSIPLHVETPPPAPLPSSGAPTASCTANGGTCLDFFNFSSGAQVCGGASIGQLDCPSSKPRCVVTVTSCGLASDSCILPDGEILAKNQSDCGTANNSSIGQPYHVCLGDSSLIDRSCVSGKVCQVRATGPSNYCN